MKSFQANLIVESLAGSDLQADNELINTALTAMTASSVKTSEDYSLMADFFTAGGHFGPRLLLLFRKLDAYLGSTVGMGSNGTSNSLEKYRDALLNIPRSFFPVMKDLNRIAKAVELRDLENLTQGVKDPHSLAVFSVTLHALGFIAKLQCNQIITITELMDRETAKAACDAYTKQITACLIKAVDITATDRTYRQQLSDTLVLKLDSLGNDLISLNSNIKLELMKSSFEKKLSDMQSLAQAANANTSSRAHPYKQTASNTWSSSNNWSDSSTVKKSKSALCLDFQMPGSCRRNEESCTFVHQFFNKESLALYVEAQVAKGNTPAVPGWGVTSYPEIFEKLTVNKDYKLCRENPWYKPNSTSKDGKGDNTGKGDNEVKGA